MIEQFKNTIIQSTTNKMKKQLAISSISNNASGKGVILHDIPNTKTSGKDLADCNQKENSSIASLENIAADCSASSSPTLLLPPNLLPLVASRSDPHIGKSDISKVAKKIINTATSNAPSMISNIESPIYAYASPSILSSNQGVIHNIKNGKILKLDPQLFLSLLDACKRSTEPQIDDPIWKNIAFTNRLCFLPIDLRSASFFQESKLFESINPSFPPLVQKRFRKRVGLSSFQLSNFLASTECSSTLSAFKESLTSKNQKPCQAILVVYDEEFKSETMNGKLWDFLGALSDGMAQGMLEGKDFTQSSTSSSSLNSSAPSSLNSKPAPIVCHLEGGYGKLVQAATIHPQYKYLFRPSEKEQEEYEVREEPLVSAMSDLLSKSAINQERPEISSQLSRELQSSIKSDEVAQSTTFEGKPRPSTYVSPPYKSGRSLSIDVYAPKREPLGNKNPVMGLKLSVKPGIGLSLSNAIIVSPVESPNEPAAPPGPYSIITKNIIIGSDVLPSSPHACTLFSEIHVTHILNMAAEIPVNQLVLNDSRFKVKWIPVYDNTEVDMDDALQQAIAFIGFSF